MQRFKKVLKILGAIGLTLFFGLTIYVFVNTPTLPKGTNKIIKEVIDNPLPELIKGQTGYAESQGLKIWYERIAPVGNPKGTVLLNMGIANDAIAWPARFVRAFVDAGYQVIRYDYRGTGMSDWVDDWDKNKPYSLADMSEDAVAILDTLGIRQAHIIGVSMGGMIAQEIAIHHPDRVASLCSMMSTGSIEDPELPPLSKSISTGLVTIALRYGIIGGEKNMSRLFISIRSLLIGESVVDLNQKEIAEQVVYTLRKRKGFNKLVSRQHQAAVGESGSRYAQLKDFRMPCLIIHGIQDPFVNIAHGRKCASIIPNADSLWVDNMGHDIPNENIALMSKKIIANFNRKLP